MYLAHEELFDAIEFLHDDNEQTALIYWTGGKKTFRVSTAGEKIKNTENKCSSFLINN